jgi:UDP-N-acetylmuramoylalanine--D-glutamate ligase
MMTATRPIQTRADLYGRSALVLGLARSGAAAARFLADAGAVVTAYDRRDADALAEAVATLGERPIELALGAPDDVARRLVDAADLLVTSPSISPRFPTTEPWLREALSDAEARGVELVSEVDLFLRLTRAQILAITGTKGKTTTTALLGSILGAAELPHVVGGNIGEPLVERSESLDSGTWAVLELSELQLPTISRGADVAVYTNILADHLDRHGSLEAYRAVKARLGELTVERGGSVVLNADDRGCRDLGGRLERDLHWYARSAGGVETPRLEAWEADGELVLAGSPLLPAQDVPLPGVHMRSNVLAAAIAARLAGAEPEAIAAGIRSFRGVTHRLETIVERDGVRWVNDSQATIPAAAIAALEAFSPSPIVLIAGGQGKGLDYGAFADAIAGRSRAAILIGETADELERLIAGRIPVRRAASMDEAVILAADVARPGDIALLSPAATSFDMFADYAARGDAFRSAVDALPGAASVVES